MMRKILFLVACTWICASTLNAQVFQNAIKHSNVGTTFNSFGSAITEDGGGEFFVAGRINTTGAANTHPMITHVNGFGNVVSSWDYSPSLTAQFLDIAHWQNATGNDEFVLTGKTSTGNGFFMHIDASGTTLFYREFTSQKIEKVVIDATAGDAFILGSSATGNGDYLVINYDLATSAMSMVEAGLNNPVSGANLTEDPVDIALNQSSGNIVVLGKYTAGSGQIGYTLYELTNALASVNAVVIRTTSAVGRDMNPKAISWVDDYYCVAGEYEGATATENRVFVVNHDNLLATGYSRIYRHNANPPEIFTVRDVVLTTDGSGSNHTVVVGNIDDASVDAPFLLQLYSFGGLASSAVTSITLQIYDTYGAGTAFGRFNEIINTSVTNSGYASCGTRTYTNKNVWVSSADTVSDSLNCFNVVVNGQDAFVYITQNPTRNVNTLTPPAATITPTRRVITATATNECNVTTALKTSNVPGTVVEDFVEIRFYPNPASNELTVDIPAVEEDEYRLIRMYDLTGRLVIEQLVPTETTSYRLDVSPLHNGHYIIDIVAGDQRLRERVSILH